MRRSNKLQTTGPPRPTSPGLLFCCFNRPGAAAWVGRRRLGSPAKTRYSVAQRRRPQVHAKSIPHPLSPFIALPSPPPSCDRSQDERLVFPLRSAPPRTRRGAHSFELRNNEPGGPSGSASSPARIAPPSHRNEAAPHWGPPSPAGPHHGPTSGPPPTRGELKSNFAEQPRRRVGRFPGPGPPRIRTRSGRPPRYLARGKVLTNSSPPPPPSPPRSPSRAAAKPR